MLFVLNTVDAIIIFLIAPHNHANMHLFEDEVFALKKHKNNNYLVCINNCPQSNYLPILYYKRFGYWNDNGSFYVMSCVYK